LYNVTTDKKVQLDKIRQGAGVKGDTKTLYHMLFMGPPGTGKTTMANLVAKLLRKMELVKNDKVVFVPNALNLIAQYAGQTAPKVGSITLAAGNDNELLAFANERSLFIPSFVPCLTLPLPYLILLSLSGG
jgi:DNA polymerase III delta prime subunit